MSWSRDIQEVLWVLAPELIFFTLLVSSFTSAGIGSPFALELLLDGVWKLDKIHWFRREDTKEERSFLILLVLCGLSIWYDHVMTWLLVMLWCQPACLSNLSLSKSLQTFGSLKNDITFIDLPESISLRLNSHNQEVDWNVWPLAHFLIFLHQTENDVSLFGHRDTELWVVEPSIIGIILHIGLLVLLLWVDLNWVWASRSVAVPLTMDGVLRPNRWENFAEIHLVEMCTEVIVSHPPVTIALEHIVELLLETFVVIPSLILVGELTSPLTLSPRISDSNELETVDFSDLLNTISMVKKDA